MMYEDSNLNDLTGEPSKLFVYESKFVPRESLNDPLKSVRECLVPC